MWYTTIFVKMRGNIHVWKWFVYSKKKKPVRTDKLLIDSSCLFVGWDGSKKGKTFHYLYIPLKFISWPELFNQENYLKTIYPNTPHLEAQSTLLYILNFR